VYPVVISVVTVVLPRCKADGFESMLLFRVDYVVVVAGVLEGVVAKRELF
jgi:hypothetical protein